MTTRKLFSTLNKERKQFPVNSPDWEWRTRAARQLAWMIRGVPTQEWTQ